MLPVLERASVDAGEARLAKEPLLRFEYLNFLVVSIFESG